MKQKWYLKTWFIAILFALWFLYGIPLIIGIILLCIKNKKDKQFQKSYDTLLADNTHYQTLLTPEMQDAVAFKKHVDSLHKEEQDAIVKISDLNTEINKLDKQLSDKKKNLVYLDDEIVVQEFGLYKPQFDFAFALDYKEKLQEVRQIQKDLIKSKNAVSGVTTWTVDGNKAKGKKMVTDTQKLLLRAFNTECDSIVSKVKYTNFDASLNKIYKSAEVISNLGTIMHIAITKQYLNAKVKELKLAFEYQQKKQEEKEAARAAREEQREQAKAMREIEEQKKRIEKEQTHYQTAFEKLMSQLNKDPENPNLLAKKSDLENTLNSIDRALSDIDYRQANMKAGYVYIISNIGAFGKDVYKIGMTRRLDPQERVDELGDASVPFKFDVHAMIFSDNAPALEAALHKAFEDKKVNLVNQRREFFHVTLDEIKEVVRQNFDKTVEFVDVPDAEQYRVSEKMRSEQHVA